MPDFGTPLELRRKPGKLGGLRPTSRLEDKELESVLWRSASRFAFIAAVACGDVGEDEGEYVAAASSGSTCPTTRFAAYTQGRIPCQSLATTNFTARNLFPPVGGSMAPGRLANYCVFEWSPPPGGARFPSAGHIQVLRDAVRPIQVDPDCPQMTTQGVLEDTWTDLHAHFQASAGVMGPLVPAPGIFARPRVVVIDTWPEEHAAGWTALRANQPVSARDHGFGMARIIEDLLCYGGRCLADVQSVQALRLDARLEEVAPGATGTHGRLGDLAQAIYEAVTLHDVAGRDPTRPTILNISVAWPPGSPAGGDRGSIENHEKAPAAAVHEALEYAACRGQIAFAAAGNDLGGVDPDDEGPVYPAAWTTWPALGPAECQNQFQLAPTASLGPTGPLVQAVGAVHPTGHALAFARPRSEPAFVANGVHGVAQRSPTLGLGPIRAMSGTSVSTAVVSAAAAAAMARFPSASRDAILQRLAQTSVPIARQAVLHDGVRSQVGRVSVCGAWGTACSVDCPGACATPPTAPTWTTLSAPAANPPSGTCIDPRSAWSAPSGGGGPICGSSSISIDELPASVPQPGEIGCAACVSIMDGTALFLDVQVVGSAVPDWLKYEDALGNVEAFDLTGILPVTFKSGSYSLFVPVPMPAGFIPVNGRIAFRVYDEAGWFVGVTASELGIH